MDVISCEPLKCKYLMIKTEHCCIVTLHSKSEPVRHVEPVSDAALCRDSDLVSLDVSILCIHRWRVPRHIQLGGCCGLNSHILGRGRRHCDSRSDISHLTMTFFDFNICFHYYAHCVY